MSADINTPVSEIEGIGPALQQQLAHAGVSTVFDLLSVPLEIISESVRPGASTDQVRAWRRMAELLQVAEVTPQWAEALTRGGVETIEQLHLMALDAIEQLMSRAQGQGIIRVTPNASQIAGMLRDSAVIHYSGLLAGTVLDVKGRGIGGATVRVGRVLGLSDARGHFRLLRIPLGRTHILRIERPDFQPLTTTGPILMPDSTILGRRAFVLQEKSAEVERGTPPLETLSELAGDVLPAEFLEVREVVADSDHLRDGDVLVVNEFYEAAPDAKLVSRLRSYGGGDLLVNTFRIPLDILPQGVRLKDQFRVVGGGLVAVAMKPLDLHRYRIRLRAQRAFGGQAFPADLDGRRAYLDALFRMLADNQYYMHTGRRRS